MPVNKPGEVKLLVKMDPWSNPGYGLEDEGKYPDFYIYVSKSQLRKISKASGKFKLNIWAEKS